MKPALRILLSIGLAAAISYVCFQRGMSTLATMLVTIPIVVITAQDLSDDVAIGVGKMYKRWKKSQTTTTIVASFDVPNDTAEALLAQIKALGGKVLK